MTVEPGQSRWRWALTGAVAAFLVLAASLLALCFLVDKELNRPFKGYATADLVLRIKKGQSAAEIGKILEQQGVIHSARFFRLYLRWFSPPTLLQAGEYRFSGPTSLIAVVSKLRDGRIMYHPLTIPEGQSQTEIVSILVDQGFGNRQKYLELLHQAELIADLDPQADTLEGYLFPDTYFLTREMSEADIVEGMLDRFRQIWTPERQHRADEIHSTLRETVTLASLIEKETGLEEERSLVSAVFHNRLKRGMRLACDPTVIYAVKLLKPWDGVINQSDLQLDSPYNTYLYPGLPPGPIANPGEKAIDAALYPADAGYLFFVSRNDGSHFFSEHYLDHRRAVQRFQR